MMNFIKMHGLGNDFVVLDARRHDVTPSVEQCRFIADRHFGVGCDTIAVLYPPKDESADIFVRYFNADGSESGACGNATRCVADLVMREKNKASCRVALTYGVLDCLRVGDDLVQVDMGAPRAVTEIDLDIEGFCAPVSVDMGNPHCVFFVEDLEVMDNSLERIGKTVENHFIFPNRTNVEFVQVTGDNSLRQITWERGSGFTLACGSGACATAVAAYQRGLCGRDVTIALAGGNLKIHLRADDNHVLMTGPVAYVFDGVLKNL